MIEPRKSALFNAWFAGHARGRIQKTFGRVLVRGVGLTRALAEKGPVLVVSNHTSWWDPLVILHASTHLLGTDGYAMMDAKNLRRLPFFGLVGAFGVDLDRPSDGAQVIRFAAKLLDRPGKLVWIFPQGAERPITEALSFREGAAHVARVARRAVTVPAAIRYEFAGEERPSLYLSFGAALPYERDASLALAAQERAVSAELSAIDAAISGREVPGEAFAEIHRRGPSWVGRLAEGFLAALTRPRGLPGKARDKGLIARRPV
ncbi:MAG: lysophospholipid acyltransferase family protein [Polyangiaceae bacterium]